MNRIRPFALSERSLTRICLQLALELQEMENRRSRLVAHLAQLNGQILSGSSNGVITSGSGASIAKRMRRRVSDHIGTSWSSSPSRFTTLAIPTKNSRRAVSSNMARLLEGIATPDEQEATFTAADIVSVAQYHRRNRSIQVNGLVADLARTGVELGTTKELVHGQTEIEEKYKTERSVRIRLEQELKVERQAGVEKDRRMREMAECIDRLEQEAAESRAMTQRANERISRLNELGLPRPPAEAPRSSTLAGSDQSPTTGKQALRHAGSLKEQRLAPATLDVEPYTPAARALKSRESDEIDRLNKVIEGLKTVQNELLGKVEEWQEVSPVRTLRMSGTSLMNRSQRVIDQNAKIQMLTSEMLGERTKPTIPSPALTPAPVATAHHPVLTPSRSIKANLDRAPTTPTPKEKTKGGYSSTALSPGSPAWGYSPRPIPMHEGMKSNASARKGRRLTVENDLERLQSESGLVAGGQSE